MARFVLNTNSLFLCSVPDQAILVLNTGTNLNNPANAIGITSWVTVATITCKLNNNNITPTSRATNPQYTELELFGTVISGLSLEKLRAELFDDQILVNREGYLVGYYNGDGSKALSLGRSSMMKLNNMFGWSRYGVRPSIATVWNRYAWSSREVVVDLEELDARSKRLGKEVEEQSEELKGCELKLAEKEEVLKHYKRLVEEGKQIMKEKGKVVDEKENLLKWFREVVDEKNAVIEEQRKRIEEQIGEIEKFKLIG